MWEYSTHIFIYEHHIGNRISNHPACICKYCGAKNPKLVEMPQLSENLHMFNADHSTPKLCIQKCVICNTMKGASDFTHIWVDGICSHCGKVCKHNWRSTLGGDGLLGVTYCTICDIYKNEIGQKNAST
ncbi:MAG: hypothetical protein LBL90_13755 [Prevotellaceae bacterium]|jgi:hypothetical protein|nr:hypothetical protein [Prevotellaceae bacterium]